MDLINNIESEYLKEDLPEFKSGDSVLKLVPLLGGTSLPK